MSSTLAIIGATGSTGKSLLQLLLQSPGQQLHVYCRSKQKLLGLFPGIDNNRDVRIFDGDLHDIKLLASCVDGVRAAFLTVAVPGNQPGCTIAQDTVKAILSALELLKNSGTNGPLPKLVFLSSSSTEHRLVSQVPKIARYLLHCAFSNTYMDLEKAEALLRSQEFLTPTTFIKPSALSHDVQRGHILSTEKSTGPLSFIDLAAGMIEVAREDSNLYDMKSVSVNPRSKDVAFPWEAPWKILRGLIVHLFPWTFRFLN